MSSLLAGYLHKFHNPQIMGLFVALLAAILTVGLFGSALAPYFTAVIMAYLLEGMVRPMERIGIPRLLSVVLVFSLFILIGVAFFFILTPALIRELSRVSNEIPRITITLKTLMQQLTQSASGWIDSPFAESMLLGLVEKSQGWIAESLSMILKGGLPGLVSVMIYLLLVPFLIFFFMKDKEALLTAFSRYLPKERTLLKRVLHEVNAGVGGYIRGKFWEMLLLGSASYLGFVLIGFQYAFLVAVLTGLSVLIPFLGLAVVTIPVVVLGVLQWGITWDATHPLIIYGILQLVDGNLIAPMILGETVQVHPTTIMLAVLFFGYLWGVAGVFFAVPLAVLVKSVLEVTVTTDSETTLA
ncbi:MAG: AI-2E family transporter [Magnetococcales bacterium]|nr:AI-2E family transporter [Magnetococcales bacterium]